MSDDEKKKALRQMAKSVNFTDALYQRGLGPKDVENESCPHNRHAILCGLCTPAPKEELTLGDVKDFLTRNRLQLRVYFDPERRDAETDKQRGQWCASLYAKGQLSLVPDQPQTFVECDEWDEAIEAVMQKWRLTYGGAS